MQWAAIIAGSELRRSALRLVAGLLAIDQDPGLHALFILVNLPQALVDKVHGRRLTVSNGGGRGADGGIHEFCS